MTSRTNEVQANMDATIMELSKRTLNFQLLLQKRLKLLIDIVDNSFKGVLFVDLITITNRIDDCELSNKKKSLTVISQPDQSRPSK